MQYNVEHMASGFLSQYVHSASFFHYFSQIYLQWVELLFKYGDLTVVSKGQNGPHQIKITSSCAVALFISV